MKLRIRRRAKKELLDIDDDATFFAVVRAVLDLEANPRPRVHDKLEGQEEVYIEAVRRKDEATYRR